LNNFRRGIPDAKLLAKLGIEGLKEWFVEILDSMGFLEFREEDRPIHAVENGGGPIEDFGEIEVFELARIGDLVEEFAQYRHAEVVGGEAPVKKVFG
jgi:hypothetical protein